MSVDLEIRTTISPGPSFFRRIHYLAASMERLKWSIGNFEIVVSVGSKNRRTNLYRTQPWSKFYPLIWRWVDPIQFTQLGYRATNRDRAWHMSRARNVMMVDSDVIFASDFSGLLRQIGESPSVRGVMAHFPPFGGNPGVDPVAWWERIFAGMGMPPPSHAFELTGWKEIEREEYRYSPAYFNGGMVVAPMALMEELFARFLEADDAVAALGKYRHHAQMSRTLAMYKAGVAFESLPMRYNFPNDKFFEKEYPDELKQVKIIHYLRREIIDREADFDSPDSVRRLVARNDLVGTNERFRQLIAELEPRVSSEEESLGAHV
jgi:hypothetical protein